MTEPKVFVEDAGTGLDDQVDADILDAAHLGAHAHDPNATDFAPVAPTLTTDYGVPEVDLSEAQYRVSATNVTSRTRDGSATTWPEVTLAVKMPSETVALTADAENYIYVDTKFADGQPDSAVYTANTTGTAPSDASLLVATIDTAAETSVVECISPDGSFGAVSAADIISNATYQSKSDIPAKYEDAGNMAVTETDGLVVFTP